MKKVSILIAKLMTTMKSISEKKTSINHKKTNIRYNYLSIAYLYTQPKLSY